MSVRAELAAARDATRQDPAFLRTWYWPLLGLILAVAFAFGETWAIVRKGKGGTATEKIRKALGVDPPRRYRRVAAAGFAGALLLGVAWFIPHIVWPGFWPWEADR